MVKDTKQASDVYKTLECGYQFAADGIGAIAESGRFPELLSRFANYRKFLRNRNLRINSDKLVSHLSHGTNVIYASNRDEALKEILYCAHMATCCEVFQGSSVPLDGLNRNTMRACADNILQPFQKADKNTLRPMSDRLENADAIMVIQILRLMGLVRIKSNNCKQLSFAAGNGVRETNGLHIQPAITRKNSTIARNGNKGNTILFEQEIAKAANIILIDNDPAFTKHYATLNNDPESRVTGIIDDVAQAMDALPGILEGNGKGLRNFIAALRIDHLMLPDVEDFLRRLGLIIEQTADLVITIGAGYTTDEFRGRITKMDEIFNSLKEKNLNPVRIILHGDGTFEEQRNNPGFGQLSISTYEIIYCKLDRRKLKQESIA
ncbi:MAG TPA: hypothetical protein ENI68_08215 [Gammaproteobacteria bacterium]|nr:hypothetical protein [Gammaproteobacteria bacterium]